MINPRTSIIATLGPASNTYEKIRDLYENGANFFRLNFSHGSQESHAALYDLIHQVRVDCNADIGVIADLSGPKHRIGSFDPKFAPEEGKTPFVTLKQGQKFRFDLDPTPGDETRVLLDDREVIEALQVGHNILLDDGNIEVHVVGKGHGYLDTEVVTGGPLSNRKGFNIPGVELKSSALTAQDKLNVPFAARLGVDWIAASFVRTPAHMMELRSLVDEAMQDLPYRPQLMAKIEKDEALKDLVAILEASDGAMVARGDLKVETLDNEVPFTQEAMIRMGCMMRKPIVAATQMHESMIVNPRATNAEIADVYWAIRMGASAVMLSAESASGRNPSKAVQSMSRIRATTEGLMINPDQKLQQKFDSAAFRIQMFDVPEATPLWTYEKLRHAQRPAPVHPPEGYILHGRNGGAAHNGRADRSNVELVLTQ